MKKILLIALGAAAGFIAAHQFGKTENGQKFFQDVDLRIQDISAAVAEGYKSREADFKAMLADLENTISSLGKK